MLLAGLVAAQGSPSRGSKWQTLNGDAPLVVARGGFSGLFPDSSEYAYQFAVQTGLPNVHAWCDVQLTKDGAGICLPFIDISNDTNIEQNLRFLFSLFQSQSLSAEKSLNLLDYCLIASSKHRARSAAPIEAAKPISFRDPIGSGAGCRQRVNAQGMEAAAERSESRQRMPLAEVVADSVKRWFQDALKEAKNGDTSMLVLVRQMYYSGYGIPRDEKKVSLLDSLDFTVERLPLPLLGDP